MFSSGGDYTPNTVSNQIGFKKKNILLEFNFSKHDVKAFF